jgi:hypothetical protein
VLASTLWVPAALEESFLVVALELVCLVTHRPYSVSLLLAVALVDSFPCNTSRLAYLGVESAIHWSVMNRHRQSLLEASKMLQVVVVVVEVSLQWYQAVWTAPEWKDQFHLALYEAPTLLRALQR